MHYKYSSFDLTLCLARCQVARYQQVEPSINAETAVAVVCATPDGDIVETVVCSATGTHYKFTDPIMYTEVTIPSLVEAQFEEGGPWVVSRGTLEGVELEKRALFAKYSETLAEDPPGCLATLRRMIQAGPINTVYSGGGNGSQRLSGHRAPQEALN
jgi:hypothetical protein